jgi:hypothetical protein
MIWEWKYSLELSNDNTKKRSSSLHEHLDKISFEEIREVKNRINFYLNHLKIISKKNYSESTENQLSFLKSLNSLLETEINRRRTKVHI